MAKTYLPGLYYAMLACQKYMTRWQAQLGANMSTEQAECFSALAVAIAKCLPLFIPPPPIE